jgi:(E)-4-hydroxy-3-methylbut-2-enyl-diphosphate synthase
VVIDLSGKSEINPASLFAIGYHYSVPLDKWNLTDQACDFIYCGDTHVGFSIPGTLGIIYNEKTWNAHRNDPRSYPLYTAESFATSANTEADMIFVSANIGDLTTDFIAKLHHAKNAVLVLTTTNAHGMAEQRAAYFKLMHAGCDIPVINWRSYSESSEDEFMLYSATDQGALLIDGLGDGVFISAPNISLARINSTAFGILQATRSRISKTEYISCPSCGRTLFDLQETTAKIRARTSHLKGVKIGIMGCIVNGPGEMADADYGYVGTGPGKITLYKEKEVVKKNVSEEEAVDELIALIKEHGDWCEPVVHENN